MGMKIITIIMGLGLFLYGFYGLSKGEISVGSRSYTGTVTKYKKQEAPKQFYFWIGFFMVLGSGCVITSLVVG